MICSIFFLTSLVWVAGCKALVVHSMKRSQNAPSAKDLIENALKAMGGKDNLNQLQSVVYHAPRYVYQKDRVWMAASQD